MISPYHDLGDYYNYHSSFIDGEDVRKYPSLPKEPNGLGSFFALSCCMSNNDCIGAQGKNAGFNLESEKIIIVDGGNSHFSTHMISYVFPTSDNGRSWLNFNSDLTPKHQKEACETFIKFASLTSEELKNLITDNERTTTLLGEEYINQTIKKLQAQQDQIVDVFYDDMIRLGCEIPREISNTKQKVYSIKNNSSLLENTTFQSTTSEDSLSSDESINSLKNIKKNSLSRPSTLKRKTRAILTIEISPQNNIAFLAKPTLESIRSSALALNLAGIQNALDNTQHTPPSSPSSRNKRKRANSLKA